MAQEKRSTFFDFIPFCELRRKPFSTGDGKNVTFNASKKETIFFNEVLGLKSCKIKMLGDTISADVTIPIHQSMLEGSSLETVRSIFMLDSRWDLTFGWASDMNQRMTLSELQPVKINITYDQSIRGYQIKIKLVAVVERVLHNIQVRRLTTFRNNMWLTDGAISTSSMTLGKMVGGVLDACRQLKYAEGIETDDGFIYTPDTVPFKFNPEEIPSADEVLVYVVDDEVNAFETYESLITGQMPETSTVNDIIKEDTVLSVEQYISNLLMERGFALVYSPVVRDSIGRPRLIIMPVMATVGRNVKEYTFKGLTKAALDAQITNSRDGITQQYTGRFDLLSMDNMIKSIEVSTDAGEDTLASELAQQAVAQGAQEDTAMKKHRFSMYEYIRKLAKSIEMTTIGLPKLELFSNLEIVFAGNLFSGTYKILEIEHSIDDDEFETSVSMIQLGESDGVIPATRPIHEAQDTAENKNYVEKSVKQFQPPEFGTERDVRVNARRYR